MASFESRLKTALGSIPSPALTTLLSKEYSDADILKNQTYKFSKFVLSTDELTSLSNNFYQDMVNGFSSKHSAKMALLLALNIRKTEDVDSCILKAHKSTNPKELDIYEIGVTRKDKGSSSSETRQEGAEKDDVLNQIDQALSASSGQEEVMSEIRASSRNLPFGPFLAAYLMKIIIKQVNNVSLGLSHMKERYLGFYPEMECPNVEITTAALTNLQNKLKFDKYSANTWIFTTADYEYDADATSVDSGVVRYLANLQFSFSAMPAYNLFRELLLKTGGDPADWIVKLWTDSTKGTLLEIHKILSQFESIIENGATKKKSKYFKYARVIDPQYFLKLQPGQSLCLIYLLARVLNHYQNYSSLSNPDKIAALTKMGERQKEFLRMLADVIIENEGEEEGEGTKYSMMARERYRTNLITEDKDETEREILKAMAEG
ncbi:TPA_asm: N [Nitraria betacytorhabdovirus 1]|nr:TPA_asm: N [Nitraria betacytorhabdovirus 1]